MIRDTLLGEDPSVHRAPPPLLEFVGSQSTPLPASPCHDEEEQALALIDQGKTGVEEAGFSCGAYCDGIWKHVNTCYGNQTCCGYIYCSSGVSQGTCCNTGQHCSWNGTGKPGAIYCINNS